MDPKKQDLNPELKEIYNRVMNTQIKPPANPPVQQAASQGPIQSLAPSAPTIDNKPLVFTGNKLTSISTGPHSGAKLKLAGPIIGILAVILIIVWGLFWAKFFGLI
jgi:hypothetical protein